MGIRMKCTAVPSVFTQQKHSRFTMIVTFCFMACKTKYWKCCRLPWDSCSLWKFFFRGQVATMTTLVEINGALGVRHLFCALRVGFFPPSLQSYAQLLYSCPAPLPHPITLYVLRISQSPEAAQAPPLATAARLVALSQVIWGKWATQRRWSIAAGIGTIGAAQCVPCSAL